MRVPYLDLEQWEDVRKGIGAKMQRKAENHSAFDRTSHHWSWGTGRGHPFDCSVTKDILTRCQTLSLCGLVSITSLDDIMDYGTSCGPVIGARLQKILEKAGDGSTAEPPLGVF